MQELIHFNLKCESETKVCCNILNLACLQLGLSYFILCKMIQVKSKISKFYRFSPAKTFTCLCASVKWFLLLPGRNMWNLSFTFIGYGVI